MRTIKELNNKSIAAFKIWLQNAGAELLEPTNEWEVVRFRAGNRVNVIYTSARGFLNFKSCDPNPIKAFESGFGWIAAPRSKRKRRPADISALLARDGDKCFLCGFPMGEDMTIEHLVPVAHCGPNHISNKALAHGKCNQLMDSKSLMEKIRLREHHQNWGSQQ